MKGIPLPTTADPMQVERVRELLEGRACVIVGSAPLQTKTADCSPAFTIAVNGAISSVTGVVDLWVVGSKKQDKPGESFVQPLHRMMLQQARGRTVGHLLLLRGPTISSEPWTLSRLDDLGCRYGSWSLLDKPTKRWLEGELCERTDDKAPCSSGILAAAMALWCGAASVRLVGFSFTAGYHYLPKGTQAQAWWRNHVVADKRALVALRERYGNRLMGDLVQAVAA